MNLTERKLPILKYFPTIRNNTWWFACSTGISSQFLWVKKGLITLADEVECNSSVSMA